MVTTTDWWSREDRTTLIESSLESRLDLSEQVLYRKFLVHIRKSLEERKE